MSQYGALALIGFNRSVLVAESAVLRFRSSSGDELPPPLLRCHGVMQSLALISDGSEDVSDMCDNFDIRVAAKVQGSL